MGQEDLWELVTSHLMSSPPRMANQCVCVECKSRGNTCVLVARNEPCMGPVTNGGCGALCPSNDRACYACWGPWPHANAKALAKQFEIMGYPPDEIARRFSEFGYPQTPFLEAAELYRD